MKTAADRRGAAEVESEERNALEVNRRAEAIVDAIVEEGESGRWMGLSGSGSR